MKWIACGFVLAILCVLGSGTKNVLFLDSVGSPSHQVWMHSLTRAVASHGYNVTTITCQQIKEAPENLHVYHWHEVHQAHDDEEIDFLQMSSMRSWERFNFFAAFLEDMDQLAMDSIAVKAILNYPQDFKFDLIIYDYLGPAAFLVFADRFPRARLIGASAYPFIEYSDKITKAPHLSAFIPNTYMDDVEEKFCSRLENFLGYLYNDFMQNYKIYPQSEKVVNKYYQLKRSLAEITASTIIVLANHNPVLDFVTPIMPAVIPVGGLQIQKPKPLPKDLEEIFANAEKGVILFALGSNVKSEMLGRERLEAIIAALSQFSEYNIVWKIDLSKLDLKIPKNIYIKTWLPQNDILADSRTKLFISHAGGLSTQEATWFGQPMLALPVMFDQFPNAEKAVKSGMALKLDLGTIDKESLVSTISELLDNPKYSDAAKLRSSNFQDQKELPIERALWWIDYVARNQDVSFLKSAKLERMNYFYKHSMDVIAFLTIVILGGFFGVAKLICIMLRTSKKNKPKVKFN